MFRYVRGLIGIILLSVSFSVSADAVCDAFVLNETEALSSSGLKGIRSETRVLYLQGVEIRVHILTALDGAKDIDAYKDSLLEECPSWRSPEGGMRENLIAVIVLVADTAGKNDVGVYSGSLWAPVFPRNAVESAIEVSMKPHLLQGDVSGGIVEFLRWLQKKLVAESLRTR